MKIRAKSVGETIDVNIICPDDGVTTTPVRIKIDDIKIDKLENHTNVLNITDKIKVYLRYPCISDIGSFSNLETTD